MKRNTYIGNIVVLPIFLILFSVNCELSEWSKWSECPECGEATQSTRIRKIKKESQFGGSCDTNQTQFRDCKPPKCPNALPSFIYLGKSIYDTPVINVTFPKYFLPR